MSPKTCCWTRASERFTARIAAATFFENVQPGSPVTFKVDAFNDFVLPIAVDQLFTINLQVLGDGVTVLDTRKVFVIVPKQLDQPIP